jgi:3-oxoacyl-(acyl-carrier-protein) synthase
VWTPGGVWLNTPPLAGPPGGALAPWPEAPVVTAIHPGSRRPHRQAVVLVQLVHALLSTRAASASSAPPPADPAKTDLLVGTATGSVGADVDFLEGLQERGSGFGSPSTFVYTLATAAPAEAALAFGLHGALATISAGSISGLCAVVRATQQVAKGRSQACITGGVEVGGVTTRAIGEIAALFLLEPANDSTPWPVLSDAEMGFDTQATAGGEGPSDSAVTTLLALASACADQEALAAVEIEAASPEGYWARIRTRGKNVQER